MFGLRFTAVTCFLSALPRHTIAIDTETVTLPLDHFGDGSGTFENRFWVSEEYYRPGGPILLFDYGSDSAYSFVDLHLHNASSIFSEMMKELNAIGILWEHRFYGKSTPYRISSQTASEELRYLTAEQALADIPHFARNFSRPNFPDVDLRPNSTPWIFIGTSYSGVRAAWARNTYPETIFAAYASSAVAQKKVDISAYIELVYQALNAMGFGNCTQDVVAAISFMDEALDDSERSAQLKATFLGSAFKNMSNAAFARELAHIIPGDFQWYGIEEGYRSTGLRSFCDWMSTDPDANEISGAEGWARTRGAEFSVGRWSTWANSTSDICKSCELDHPYTDPADVSWAWQCCTEIGNFFLANRGPNQIVSKYRSEEAFSQMCHYQFPDGRSSGLLPDLPRVDEINDRFGGWKIRPSNVYCRPKYKVTQEIPDCGKSTAQDTVFGYVGPGGLHNFDMFDGRGEFPPGETSRQYFYSAMKKWLPGFGADNQTTAEATGIDLSSAPTTPALTSAPQSSATSSAVTFATAPPTCTGMALLMIVSLVVLAQSCYRI